MADEDVVLDRFRQWRATGDRRVRNALIEEHRWIALTCARRFARRGESLDDLVQVAQLGVLKAVERFDPDHGTPFVTYAMPTALGELRRHFRDATWALRVPRRAKELHLRLAKAVDALSHDLKRNPSVEELAEHMQCTVDDVLTAMEAGASYRAARLSRPTDGDHDDGGESVEIAVTDRELSGAENRIEAAQLLASLPERERRILELRFFEDRTQSEIAEIMGISQVHVSRLLRSSMRRIREQLSVAEAVAS